VIHVPRVDFQAIAEPKPDDQPMFDIQNTRCMDSMARTDAHVIVGSMNDSMVQNTFSATPTATLPISAESISQSVQQDPKAMLLDALRMAIMAGNPETVSSVVGDIDEAHIGNDDIGRINSFHLAAAFIDGGNTCCATFVELTEAFSAHH
jgi:hypothetical protein